MDISDHRATRRKTGTARREHITLLPWETFIVAEDAPPLQMVLQNVGPATFEVTVERESFVLMPGKMTLMLAYGTIVIENLDNSRAIAQIEFLPRGKSYEEAR